MRTRLRIAEKTRDLALFNITIDSKQRGCDLNRLQVRDIAHGGPVLSRASVIQQKTGQPVRLAFTEQTQDALRAWITEAKLISSDYLFASRLHDSPHLSKRQYSWVVKGWVELIGGDPREYGTHSLRRTKATLIYRRTKNLRAV